jgi:hypothetical protein
MQRGSSEAGLENRGISTRQATKENRAQWQASTGISTSPGPEAGDNASNRGCRESRLVTTTVATGGGRLSFAGGGKETLTCSRGYSSFEKQAGGRGD